MSRIFDRPDTTAPWDYVFNLGGETALSQTPELYRLRSYTLSTTLAAEAAKRNCGVFVEASIGMVYSPTRNPPRKEGDKLKPWLKLAKAKLEAEEALSRIPGLNLHARASATNRWLRSFEARLKARADTANSAMNPQSPMMVPRKNGRPAA